MKCCFVCGASPVEEPRCSDCGTPFETLLALQHSVGRQRFLFGSLKAHPSREPKSFKDTAHLLPSSHWPDPAIKPAVSRQAVADLICNRDAALPSSGSLALSRFPVRTAAHLLDVGLCMALNFWVLRLILWSSGRSLLPLINFSMVPLCFVLLCFTVLYFWLFLSLLGKSLGRMVLEWVRNRAVPREKNVVTL